MFISMDFMVLVNCTVLLFFCSSRPAEEADMAFKALEVLMLDDNKLSSEVFNSLTNLKRS